MKEWWINKQRNETVSHNTKQGKYANRQKHSKFYQSGQWQQARLHALTNNPLCVECLRQGLTVVGNIVDHIIPLSEDWSLRLDANNHQVLCESCHSRKTVQEQVNKRTREADILIENNVNELNTFV
jgi:5-methylcytosine-specific restriction protein A